MDSRNKYKFCASCNRMLSVNYPDDLCPGCLDRVLFDEVRDFVRSNEVNEYDVAAHFDIPVRIVRDWIHEGRIEYKPRDEQSIGSTYCSRCGKKVNFGSLCQGCLKLLNGEKRQGFHIAPKGESGKMRFHSEEEEE